MSSVLQGGRRRRRPGGRIARVLMLLLPVAAVVGAVFALGHKTHPGSKHVPPSPAAAQQTPGATPSPGTVAPDPAQAALAGVDAFHVRFHVPPRAGIVFDVKTGEVLWRRDPIEKMQIASITKIMTALLVVEHTHPRQLIRITKDALNYQGSGVGLLPK